MEWTETRNLATSEGERAGRIMAATAEASPELKRLAGVAATGRKLEKPVCHYSLSWAKDEKPHRQEMRRAAQESLKALGMERHQALVVSHRDGQPHVHVIANRVDPESGKAAGLNRSKLKLSKWAEEYERGQGKIRCPQRERNNARRGQGKRVQDRVLRPTGRHRRAEMSPQREQRQAIPAGRYGWGGPERERVAWQRAEERGEWEQLQRRRGKALNTEKVSLGQAIILGGLVAGLVINVSEGALHDGVLEPGRPIPLSPILSLPKSFSICSHLAVTTSSERLYHGHHKEF